jgi:hypothetical protein
LNSDPSRTRTLPFANSIARTQTDREADFEIELNKAKAELQEKEAAAR